MLLSLLAVVVLAFAGALAASHRGFTGSISHALHSLTDPHAPVPSNGPGRLTAVGSVRARYWNEALKVFQAHPALGAGAEGYATARLRYRTETLDVRHAHGYIVQTLADLGLVGLGPDARAAARLDGRGGTLDASVQPPLEQLEHAARLARSQRQRRRAGLAAADGRGRARGAIHAGARRACSACSAWSSCSASIRSRTGPGTCRATPAWRCCAPAGWPAADRCGAAAPRSAPAGSPRAIEPGAGRASSAALGVPEVAGGGVAGACRAGGAGLPVLEQLRARLSARALGPVRITVAVAAIVGALLAAWVQWQPQRSANALPAGAHRAREQPAWRALGGADGGLARPALGAGAVHAVGRAAGDRQRRRWRARRCSARCACSRRTRRRG